MRICVIRTGIVVRITAADRDRLEAVVADRNSPQKHVWRAKIDRLTHHCDIVETGNDSWRFKTAPELPTASWTSIPTALRYGGLRAVGINASRPRHPGSLLHADPGSRSRAD